MNHNSFYIQKVSDPLLTGKLAVSAITAVQNEGVAVALKHFAANNKEENRKNLDSRLSERALREIYLRGFEIAVDEADPWSIMSSYNYINGRKNAENGELLNGILRTEWGYNGVVFTDWQNNSAHVMEVLAGNDIKMTNSQPAQLVSAVEAGTLTREQLEVGAERVLNLIMKVNYFKDRIVNVPVVDIKDGTVFKAAENIIWSDIVYTETTTDTDGGKNVYNCNAGAYTEYEINAVTGGAYLLSARIASAGGSGLIDMLVDGELMATFTAVSTGSDSTWATIGEDSTTPVYVAPGRHTLTFRWPEGGPKLNWVSFSLVSCEQHTVSTVVGVQPTYAADGYRTHYYCETCGRYFEDEAATVAIDDIQAWKMGEGKLEKLAVPTVTADGNTATFSGEARRVYWGYIGTENTEYTWFDEFKAQCGDSFTPEYSPKDGDEYTLTKAGFYRFVVNYIGDNGERIDVVYTVEVESEKNSLPVIEAADNFAVLSITDVKPRKLYYGYIGEENTAYDGFDTSIFTEADFGLVNGKKYRMTKKGYYRFVVNYLDKNGKSCDLIYTLECSETLAENAGTPIVTFEGNTATLDYNNAVEVNKMYVGYFGSEELVIDNWSDYTAKATRRNCIQAPADGLQTELLSGCCVILVNYTDENGKNHDVYYTYMVK